jgi:outer membrane biosynthesis protein TonB
MTFYRQGEGINMKRFVALVAVVGLCMAFSMGCKKMTAPAETEDQPEAQAETTTPPPPPLPPATPAEPATPEPTDEESE